MGTMLDPKRSLTTSESRAEFDYRFKERVGMMLDSWCEPPEEVIAFAQSETLQELRLLRAALTAESIPKP